MYPLAVEDGIASNEYWMLTFDEILVQIEANQKIEERKAKERMAYDYKMAQLFAYSVNDPKNMPTPETFYPMLKEPEEEMTQEEKDYLEMKKDQDYMMAIAEQIKATRNRKQ